MLRVCMRFWGANKIQENTKSQLGWCQELSCHSWHTYWHLRHHLRYSTSRLKVDKQEARVIKVTRSNHNKFPENLNCRPEPTTTPFIIAASNLLRHGNYELRFSSWISEPRCLPSLVPAYWFSFWPSQSLSHTKKLSWTSQTQDDSRVHSGTPRTTELDTFSTRNQWRLHSRTNHPL